jgi:hypothetical protein
MMATNINAKDQCIQGVYKVIYNKKKFPTNAIWPITFKYICVKYDSLFNDFEMIIIYHNCMNKTNQNLKFKFL